MDNCICCTEEMSADHNLDDLVQATDTTLTFIHELKLAHDIGIGGQEHEYANLQNYSYVN